MIVNPSARIELVRGFRLPVQSVVDAVTECNRVTRQIAELPVDIFQMLGMRNLSAFVGEVFAASLQGTAPKDLLKNPHQDGYPDLLLLDDIGSRAFAKLKSQARDKGPFSPFVTGGLEIKATCGSTPTDARCKQLGLGCKPGHAETRIKAVNGYDWKAHHRQTNHLMGLFWDFRAAIPFVAGVFFSNQLTEADWGAIVQPKSGGGRTTSVSIMSRTGLQKMYRGWICVTDDPQYSRKFNQINRDTLIPIPPPSATAYLRVAEP